MKPYLLAFVVTLLCIAHPARGASSRFHPDLQDAAEDLLAAQAPEAYAALREVWGLWDRADPIHVEQLLRSVETDTTRNASVRAYAGLLGAYCRLRRGDLVGAREKISSLGFIDKWLVAGPFDDEGKSGLQTAFGPEDDLATPIVPGKAYSGKEGPVRYRVVPDVFPLGYVDTGSLVRPERRVCVYATTYVTRSSSNGDTSITAWLGAAGAFKLFWNGAVVLEDTAYRGHDAERYAVALKLKPGNNSLTVKICGQDRAPVLSARLADSKGVPDPSLVATSSLEAASAGPNLVEKLESPDLALAKSTVRGPMQQFQQITGGPRPSARHMAEFAEYLLATDGDDPARHEARDFATRAAEAEPTLERVLLAARLAEDRNARARWIERAEKIDDNNLRVLLARAALLDEGMNFQESLPIYDRILSVDPDNLAAIRGRVVAYNSAGLRRTALSVLERAVERQPRSVTLLNMLASQLSILGRTTEAAEVQSRYIAYRFDDRSYHSEMVELAVARRSPDDAEHWIDRLLGAEPDSQWALGVSALAHRALGQPDRAVADYQRALDLAPNDVETLHSLAELQGALGDRAEQVALLQRILSVTPQEKDVREYVDYLSATGTRPDEALAWEPKRFLPLEHTPTNGQNRRTLVDLTVSTVFRNGLARKFRQIVFQPLTDAAAALARQYSFTYQADRERVQLRGARVFRADGRIDEAIESGEAATDNPAIAMYTSARTFYVQFPRLEPGDVVELRYRVDDVSAQNEFADYFGDIEYLQSSDPTLHAEYVLITPKDRHFYVDHRKLARLEQSVRETEDSRIYRFVARNVPAIYPEPHMPPWPAVLGFVHVSTYKTWKEVGAWYWGLVKDQFDLDDETRQLAHRIVKGARTEEEKVRAIYNWVVENTRYVALEFGIYGFKPRRCVQTIARGWGDCKDKATVIVTLLKELGIPATIVIVRSALRGDFRSDVASLAPFDHAIAYVPSLNRYLDGTAEWTGSTELPALLRDALALKINEGNAELVRLPKGNPRDDLRQRKLTVDLRDDGRAEIEVRQEARGVHAAGWRRRYHAMATRRQRIGQDLGAQIPGFQLSQGPAAVTADDLQNLDTPVILSAEGSTDRFARLEEATRLTMDVTVDLRLTSEFASLSTRKLPLVVPPIGIVEDVFVVNLPKGTTVLSSPPPVVRNGDFGSYEISTDVTESQVRVESRVSIGAQTISPKDYAKWKAFCAEVDHALEARLVIGRK